MIHGRGVDKALVAEQKPLESQNATDTLLPYLFDYKPSDFYTN